MAKTTLFHTDKQRRTRLAMFAVLTIALAAVGSLYAILRQAEAQAQLLHKQTLVEYVALHHLGTLSLIDDGTGLAPSSYMLVLIHPVPDVQEETFAMQLMKLYVQYDHGQALSIVYTDPLTNKRRPLADVNFDDDHKVLVMTLTNQEGISHKIVRHENW